MAKKKSFIDKATENLKNLNKSIESGKIIKDVGNVAKTGTKDLANVNKARIEAGVKSFRDVSEALANNGRTSQGVKLHNALINNVGNALDAEKNSVIGSTIFNTATNMGKGALKSIEGAADTISDSVVNPIERSTNYIYDYATKGKSTADENLKDLKQMQQRDIKRSLTDEMIKDYTKMQPELEKNSLVKEGNIGGQVSQGVGGMVPALVLGNAYGGAEPALQSTQGLTGSAKAKAILGNIGKTYASQMPANLMLGASAYGGGMEEALNDGANMNQARLYGLTNAAIEQGTEYLTGGIPGLSGKGGIDQYVEPLINRNTNGYLNALLRTLYRGAGEGLEEFTSGMLDPLAKKIYSNEKIDWNKEFQNALREGAIGSLTGAFLNAPQSINDFQNVRAENQIRNAIGDAEYAEGNSQYNPDYKGWENQRTENRVEEERRKTETKQRNEEVERIQTERAQKQAVETQREQDNTVKQEPIKRPVEDVSKGKKTQDIKQFSDVKEDYKTYYTKSNLKNFDSTILNKAKEVVEGSKRYGRTKQQWLDVADNIGTQLQGKDINTIKKYAFESFKDQMPNRNFNKQGKGYQSFGIHEWVQAVYNGAKVNAKYSEQLGTSKIQNFRDSMAREGLQDKQGFYKAVEKIIADKDYNVIMDSSITNGKGQAVNAMITNENGITIKINPNSERAGEILLMHEITHGIETKEMSNLIMDYASKNKEFNAALEDLKSVYGTEDVSPEVVADISGQLLGNQEFISNLSTTKPSVFKRIYDKIVEIANKITGNSKEALFVRDLKNKWEKAYRESNIESAQQNLKEGAKYSQNSEVTDNDGNVLSKGQEKYFDDSKIRDDNGNLVKVYHTMTNEGKPFYEFNPVGTPGYKYGNDVVNFYTDSKEMSGSYADGEYKMADTSKNADTNKKAKWQYEGYLDIKNPYVVDAEGKLWSRVVVELDEKTQKAVKEMSEYKDVLTKLAEESEQKHKEYLGKSSKKHNIQESVLKHLNDSDLGELYDMGMVGMIDDYNQMYEKATENGFDLPKPDTEMRDIVDEDEIEFMNENYGEYDTDRILRKNVSEFIKDYYDTSQEYYKFGAPQAWFENEFKKEISKDIDTNILSDYSWYQIAKNGFNKRTIEEHGNGKYYETNDIVKYVLNENKNLKDKYDGVVFKNVVDYGWGPVSSHSPHDVYVTFNSNQFKAADNLNPTTDQDIRYSQKAKKWQDFLDKYFKNKGTTTDLRNKSSVSQKETLKEVKKNAQKITQELNDAIKGKALTQEKISNLEKETGRVARGYIETTSEALNSAEQIDSMDKGKITYEPISNEETINKARQAFSGTDYNQRLNTVKDFINSDRRVTALDIAKIDLVLEEAYNSGKYQDYNDLLQDTSILLTETGQASQASSIIQKIAKQSPMGQLQTLKKIIAREQFKGNKLYNNVELKEELVQKVLDSYEDGKVNQKALDEAMDALKQDIADQMPVGIAEKMRAWRYLSMLGNPKTHIRNVLANVVMAVVRTTENLGQAAAQDIFIKDVNKKTKTLKRASSEVKAFAKQAAEETFKNDTRNKYNEQSDIEGRRKMFKSKFVNKASDINSNLLTKEDVKFKIPHYEAALENYLTAKGIKTAQDIENNKKIVKAAQEYAFKEAQYATFNQDNKLASKINEFDKLHPIAKVARGAIIPFTRTPLNIAAEGLERTPGLGIVKIANDVKKAPSNMKAATLVDGLSKQVTGSSLALIGYILAKGGFVTYDSGDDKEGKFEKDQGSKMNFSVKIGDTSYDLSWLSPSAMPLFVGAAMYEQLEKSEGINGNIIMDGIASTLDPLSEMSCIKSFTDVLRSYNKDGAGMIKSMGEKTTQNYLSQYIPTVLSQFARVFDDKKRNTYANKNSQWTFGEETLKQLAYKVPLARNLLPEQTDYLGNTKKESEDLGTKIFESFLSPANTRKDTTSEVGKEILDVYNKTGDDSVIPYGLNGYIKYNDEQYNMTQREYNTYKKTYGTTLEENVKKAMETKAYKNATNEEKAKIISGLQTYAKDKAKDEYLTSQGIDYSSTSDKVDELTKGSMGISDYYTLKGTSTVKVGSGTTSIVNGKHAKENIALVDAFNIDAKDYLKYSYELNQIKADKDRYGNSISGSAKRKKAQYIQSLPLSAVQKQMLYSLKVDQKKNKQTNSQVINTIEKSNLTKEEKTELYNYIYG